MKKSRFLILLWTIVTISFVIFHNATSNSSPPVALSPAGYVTVVSDFQWQADPSASGYHLLLTQADTGQTIYETFNFSGTALTLPSTVALNFNVKYSWKVQSQYSSSDFSAWSNSWDFALYDPAFVPTPNQPGSFIPNLRPIFDWSGVGGAANYDFELTQKDNQLLIQSARGLSSSNYSLQSGISLVYHTVYTWRVRASDSAGNAGRWSEPLDFLIYDQLQVPTIIAPKAYIPDLSPTFSWSAVTAAVSYQVQIMDFGTSTIIFDTTTSSTSISHPVSLNTVYHWRVRVISSTATGHWANWQSFKVYDAGFSPTLSAPSGDILSLTPIFTWNAVNGATAYELEVLSGSQIVYQGSSIDPSLNLLGGFKLSNRTSYTWHVRAVKASSEVSQWSPLLSLNAIDPEMVPLPIGPTATLLSVKPSFLWNGVNGASSYDVETRDSQGNLVFSQQIGASSTVLQSPVELVNYGVYHWKVRTVAWDRYTYPWSPEFTFSVFIDISRTPLTLTELASADRNSITLNWNRVVGADHYVITLVPQGRQKTIQQIKSSGTTLNIARGTFPEGPYSAQVRGVDSRGIQTPNSNSISITIGGATSKVQASLAP